jgi:hypothetical protein
MIAANAVPAAVVVHVMVVTDVVNKKARKAALLENSLPHSVVDLAVAVVLLPRNVFKR